MEGGLYFNGATPWGNRVATEKEDVQNMLIDACKLYLAEYHVDGFRFDATSTNYMDHGFMLRLADELKLFSRVHCSLPRTYPISPISTARGLTDSRNGAIPFMTR